MRSFGSDNHSGIHPDILKAIEEANTNHALAYGDDPWTKKAEDKIKETFGHSAEVCFVFNGTGANILALRSCAATFNSIISADTAHIAVDECGAPEFMTGAALKEIATPNGKLTPELIRPLLHGWGFEHHSQPKVVYISQCTELGTVYRVEEIRELAEYLHRHNMYLHVDGARLANAAATLGKTLKEISADCDIDILSFGGTKNGMMMGESVISFRPELSENMKYIRKQSCQLYSKMRFTACQFLAYLDNSLWLNNALHANEMAQLLRNRILEMGNFKFTQDTEANILLLKMPKPVTTKLLKEHFFYFWDESQDEIRLVTSWDTTKKDIDEFIESLAKAL